MSRAQLDALVEEATVDCHDEDEQVSGLYTIIVDNLAVPFRTTVLGVEVTVEDIDLTGRNHIVAHCSRGAFRQAISVLDLPLPAPPPEGARWIALGPLTWVRRRRSPRARTEPHQARKDRQPQAGTVEGPAAPVHRAPMPSVSAANAPKS